MTSQLSDGQSVDQIGKQKFYIAVKEVLLFIPNDMFRWKSVNIDIILRPLLLNRMGKITSDSIYTIRGVAEKFVSFSDTEKSTDFK